MWVFILQSLTGRTPGSRFSCTALLKGQALSADNRRWGNLPNEAIRTNLFGDSLSGPASLASAETGGMALLGRLRRDGGIVQLEHRQGFRWPSVDSSWIGEIDDGSGRLLRPNDSRAALGIAIQLSRCTPRVRRLGE